MDKLRRFQEITKGVVFCSDPDCNSLEQMLKIGKQNIAAFNKLRVLGQDRVERMRNCISEILAEGLQPAARKAYGDISDASIRRLLQESTEAKRNLDDWTQSIKQAIANEGFTQEQVDRIWPVFERIPGLILDLVVELAGAFRLMEHDRIPQISATLVEMFKEVDHADANQHN